MSAPSTPSIPSAPSAPSAPSRLGRLYRGLETLYQTETGVDPDAMVVRQRSRPSGPREQLLLREADDGDLEVALVFDEQLLARFESITDRAFADEHLGDAFPVVEGLSHLVYLAEAARRERPVSGLELETQAEVDKLGLCVLARWPAPRDAFDRLVDRLYYRFELHPMTDELAARYHAANRLALGFSRRLRPHVVERRLPAVRRTLRSFWRASMPGKRALAGAG